jgi:hypothetical protein
MKKKKEAEIPKLTEIESLRFGKFDAELRNVMQGIQLKEYEIEKINRDFVEKKNATIQQKIALNAQLEEMKPRYTELVEGLAKKYKIDPKNMTIDPDSGVIRDLGP